MEWLIVILGALIGGGYAWHRQRVAAHRIRLSLPPHYVPVIDGGAFCWGRNRREALEALCLIDGGLAVVGTEIILEIAFHELRGVFRDEAARSNIQFDLYLEREGRWGWLTVFLRLSDAPTLAKVLRRARPDLIIGDAADVAAFNAQLAQQTLHGDLTIGADVVIHVLGRLVVITQHDLVLAKLTTAGIRRVIATEQANGGLVRLYSATETTLFFSPQYLMLAQSLADHARAPLDVVTISERKSK